MLGNCSHCHNPRGFPSVKKPELREALNFLPGDGRRHLPVPARPDQPAAPARRRPGRADPLHHAVAARLPGRQRATANWTPKWSTARCGHEADRLPKADRGDGLLRPRATGRLRYIEAPWRSLIYRNVDTPFIYADDFVIFPHMPRALGRVRLPGPAHHGRLDGQHPGAAQGRGRRARGYDVAPQAVLDTHAQPYEEVKPGEPRYELAQESGSQAAVRVPTHGKRYATAPTEGHRHPGPRRRPPRSRSWCRQCESSSRQHKEDAMMPPDGVPERAHVVPRPDRGAGSWDPRRADWDDVLVNPRTPAPDGHRRRRRACRVLRGVRITRSCAASHQPVPFGLWKQKPGCDSPVKTARRSSRGQDRPLDGQPRRKLTARGAHLQRSRPAARSSTTSA